MKNSSIGLTISLLSIIAGAACSSMPKTLEKPDVALQSLDIQKASLTDATVQLKLEVRNPNDFRLPIDSVKYGLTLNGKPFASGKMNEGATIPANGETVVTVPIRMNYLDLYNSFTDLLNNKSNAYQISGQVISGKVLFPFEHNGEVKLPAPNT